MIVLYPAYITLILITSGIRDEAELVWPETE